MIVAIASAFAPSLTAAHVAPGTHVSRTGADTVGKRAVEPALLAVATVFADEVARAVTPGRRGTPSGQA